MSKRERIIAGVASLALVLSMLALLSGGALPGIPGAYGSGRQRFGWIITGKATVEQGGLNLAGGDLYVYSGAGPEVWHLDDATGNVIGLGYDFQGGVLDLDVDNDTSITADTDDQIDIEVAGTDQIVVKAWATTITTDTTTHLIEVLGTTPVFTAGTNIHSALNIDLAIGNATAGTNSVYGILIDTIVQDVQNTEAAISVGSGWDVGLDLNDNTLVNVGAAGTDFGSDGSLTTAKGITISDGDLVVADDLRVTAQTSITVTNGAAFTPTGTYQNITTASEVTPTITAGATAGDLLILINTSAQTINVADSGTAKLSAAWAAGQYDVLVLWSDGTNWIEISRSNN